jgi:hypothetical protein
LDRYKDTKTFSCTRGKIRALSTKEAIMSVKSLAKELDFSEIMLLKKKKKKTTD